MHIKKCILTIFLILTVCVSAYSDTHNADSCSQSDVQTAINAASSGDVVSIPSGTCSWASAVTLNKNITVIGQTTTSRNNSTYVVTPTDSTIIQKFGF